MYQTKQKDSDSIWNEATHVVLPDKNQKSSCDFRFEF